MGRCVGGACGNLTQPCMSRGDGAPPEESKACGGGGTVEGEARPWWGTIESVSSSLTRWVGHSLSG